MKTKPISAPCRHTQSLGRQTHQGLKAGVAPRPCPGVPAGQPARDTHGPYLQWQPHTFRQLPQGTGTVRVAGDPALLDCCLCVRIRRPSCRQGPAKPRNPKANPTVTDVSPGRGARRLQVAGGLVTTRLWELPGCGLSVCPSHQPQQPMPSSARVTPTTSVQLRHLFLACGDPTTATCFSNSQKILSRKPPC